MRNKKTILYFLLVVTIIMVVAPTIPHHHHSNGIICMKDDIKETDCCPMHHHHHHQNDDPCCTGDCPTTFKLSVPTADTQDIQPQFTYIDILFTESLLRFLTTCEEKTAGYEFVYLESLHGTYIARAAGLRAPPSFMA